jgi:uncharacterized protein YjbJ (UPF0337 family)
MLRQGLRPAIGAAITSRPPGGLAAQRIAGRLSSPGMTIGVDAISKTAEGAVSNMTDVENPELTREGLFGMVAGKAKEAAGELVGNEALADAGRAQQAEVEAAPKATTHADDEKPGDE